MTASNYQEPADSTTNQEKRYYPYLLSNSGSERDEELFWMKQELRRLYIQIELDMARYPEIGNSRKWIQKFRDIQKELDYIETGWSR